MRVPSKNTMTMARMMSFDHDSNVSTVSSDPPKEQMAKGRRFTYHTETDSRDLKLASEASLISTSAPPAPRAALRAHGACARERRPGPQLHALRRELRALHPRPGTWTETTEGRGWSGRGWRGGFGGAVVLAAPGLLCLWFRGGAKCRGQGGPPR